MEKITIKNTAENCIVYTAISVPGFSGVFKGTSTPLTIPPQNQNI